MIYISAQHHHRDLLCERSRLQPTRERICVPENFFVDCTNGLSRLDGWNKYFIPFTSVACVSSDFNQKSGSNIDSESIVESLDVSDKKHNLNYSSVAARDVSSDVLASFFRCVLLSCANESNTNGANATPSHEKSLGGFRFRSASTGCTIVVPTPLGYYGRAIIYKAWKSAQEYSGCDCNTEATIPVTHKIQKQGHQPYRQPRPSTSRTSTSTSTSRTSTSTSTSTSRTSQWLQQLYSPFKLLSSIFPSHTSLKEMSSMSSIPSSLPRDGVSVSSTALALTMAVITSTDAPALLRAKHGMLKLCIVELGEEFVCVTVVHIDSVLLDSDFGTNNSTNSLLTHY